MKSVVCVLGNNKPWNSVLGERLPAARKAAEVAGVTLLQENAVSLPGCRFVGTTLWIDDTLAGDTAEPRNETVEAIRVEQKKVEQERGTVPLTIDATVAQHRINQACLTKLIDAHTGPEPLVAVTHHAPHPDCVWAQDHGTSSAGHSASDFSLLLDTGQIDLRVHVHLSADSAPPSDTLIRCNSTGIQFDHQDFDDALVVTPRWMRNACLLRKPLAPIRIKAWAGPVDPITFSKSGSASWTRCGAMRTDDPVDQLAFIEQWIVMSRIPMVRSDLEDGKKWRSAPFAKSHGEPH